MIGMFPDATPPGDGDTALIFKANGDFFISLPKYEDHQTVSFGTALATGLFMLLLDHPELLRRALQIVVNKEMPKN